jgi:hypothetical protein
MSQDTGETEQITTVSTSRPTETEVVKTTKVVPPPVKVDRPQQVFEKKKFIFRTYQVVWYILGIIELLLGFRVALKALGADQTGGFTSLVYAVSEPFALPFSGVLPAQVRGTSFFEWSTLIAAAVYALLAFGLVHLMQFMKPVTPHEVEQKVDNS